MTIDSRFSFAAFEKLGRDSAEAEALAKELAEVIANRMADVVSPAFKQISQELIALGHDLVPDHVEIDSEFDTRGYAYRDVGQDRGSFDRNLRIHFDTQVCSGYPHEKSVDEIELELFGDDT